MAKRGLVVGKFFPPHLGHSHLINAGRAQVDELSVIACHRPHEQPPGELRGAWLREIHPDVNVLLIEDTDDEQDPRVWAQNSVRWLGFTPDVLFTSEDYGDAFAQCLGCEHVVIDKARTAVPISGTKLRSAPLRHLHFLTPPVRAWYVLRICLVGAESTGKTTLAKALAARYRTAWVAEYGREYSEQKSEAGLVDWSANEFISIARIQCERENAAARKANQVLFCDTDAFATSIWYRRYFHTRSPEVEAIAAQQKRPDLYLLTDVDIPFEQDGIRDGEAIRNWMHLTFLEELTLQRKPFAVLSGSVEERLAKAVNRIDELISAGQR